MNDLSEEHHLNYVCAMTSILEREEEGRKKERESDRDRNRGREKGIRTIICKKGVVFTWLSWSLQFPCRSDPDCRKLQAEPSSEKNIGLKRFWPTPYYFCNVTESVREILRLRKKKR